MDSRTCKNICLKSYQKWKIGNDVRTILLSNPDLVAMVGEDIYPLVAPEGTEGSFILYQRGKYTKQYTKMGVYEDECNLIITAISDNYDNALDLASEIDNTLTGVHSDGDIKFEMRLSDSEETFEDDKYLETLVFTIK